MQLLYLSKVDELTSTSTATARMRERLWLPSPQGGGEQSAPGADNGKIEKAFYLNAEKRLSNEFDDTIGCEPATRLSFAGAAAAGVSESDGFSGGRMAACLVSGFGVALVSGF